MSEKRRCSQLTVKGEPCKSYAMRGTDRCAQHLGRVGRKTKLTPELEEQLLQMLRAGNYTEVACRAVGVSRRTFVDWLRRARSKKPADEPFRELAERVDKARAEGEVRNVAVIAQAARQGDWRAALALLEREFPERWGPVSVRTRDVETPQPTVPTAPLPDDPFAEVDELAERRRRTSSA